MRLTRRAAIVVALCLAAFARSAVADCAWVLWAGGIDEPARSERDVWRPVSGYPGFEPCLQAAEERSERRYQTGAYVYHLFFMCLPESVDPRRPAGQ
ncbi:MAG TPA: hypothetical protein VJS92_04205 [Candidatus Polarisedimenticolaceae bacterium]|nr:hypothetical protein [Candidatus Polarisedimenticolaceae bacterium]